MLSKNILSSKNNIVQISALMLKIMKLDKNNMINFIHAGVLHRAFLISILIVPKSYIVQVGSLFPIVRGFLLGLPVVFHQKFLHHYEEL